MVFAPLHCALLVTSYHVDDPQVDLDHGEHPVNLALLVAGARWNLAQMDVQDRCTGQFWRGRWVTGNQS